MSTNPDKWRLESWRLQAELKELKATHAEALETAQQMITAQTRLLKAAREELQRLQRPTDWLTARMQDDAFVKAYGLETLRDQLEEARAKIGSLGG